MAEELRSEVGIVEPIRMEVLVRRSPEDAFSLFTAGMTSWWPMQRFTFGPGRSHEVLMEPFVGGRFYERYTDGDEFTIGQVLVWEPHAESCSRGAGDGPCPPKSPCNSRRKNHWSRKCKWSIPGGSGSARKGWTAETNTQTAGRPFSPRSSNQPPARAAGADYCALCYGVGHTMDSSGGFADATHAVLLLLLYVAVFVAISAWLSRTRDITS
jgi:hypothetical protein